MCKFLSNHAGRLLRFSFAFALAGAFIGLGSTQPLWADGPAAAPRVQAFLEHHCVECHGADEQSADRRFDTLSYDFTTAETLEHWQDMLDQLNLGQMPPEDSPRPSDAELKEVTAWITAEISKGHEVLRVSQEQSALRRLNQREYRNTVRDLLQLNLSIFDPTQGFPEDEKEEGFDNQGATLVTSGYLLDKYLEAAEQVIDRAIVGERPAMKKYRFTPPFDRTTRNHSGWVSDERRHTREYQSIFQGTKDRFGYRPLDDIAAGVPQDGYYRVRIKACGLHRHHKYEPRLIGTDPGEPLRLALISGSQSEGTLHLRQPGEKTLAVFNLPDDEPQWMECRIWLDRGSQPRMTYQNGPYFFKSLPGTLRNKQPELFSLDVKRDGWWKITQNINTPQIRIFEVEIEGPLWDHWPPESHRILLGDAEYAPERTQEILERFASRAFRRPATKSEVDALVALVDERRAEGDPPLTALKTGLAAVLCSPSFLYIQQTDAVADTPQAEELALASRLSYFLWSSMPDESLLKLASKGKLANAEVLRAEAERMLADPKADALTQSFVDSWLRLDKLGVMPPDNSLFKPYYIHELEWAMRRECELFFQHALQENLDLEVFLDSDFTFANRALAHHYQFETTAFDALASDHQPGHRADDGFLRVAIPNRQRGGLLGQAGVLTVTANGIDTSPVIRGIWLLENVLGTKPAPPPPDVEPLEPDIRGATTIREQLQKHRENATCYECHRKIDPLGFALEGFDAIGGTRMYYDTRRRMLIDTSGEMPDGKSFDDMATFKQVLRARKPQFVGCLTEKMLIYALGRPLTIRDRPEVDRIVMEMLKPGRGLRDLVLLTVESEAFAQLPPAPQAK